MRIEIKDIKFNEELYPREQFSHQTAYIYSQSMQSGASFPPVKVALLNGQYILIDGRHRIEALKMNEETDVEAEVVEETSFEKLFEQAIKDNVSHGRALNPYEKRRAALKLRQWKYGNEEISRLIQIPLGKLDNFIGQRLVNSLTGETIVKSEISHFAGTEVGNHELEEIRKNQKSMFSRNQRVLLNNVYKLLKKGYFDLNDKEVTSKLKSIKKILNRVVFPVTKNKVNDE